MAFTGAALRFLRGLKRNNNKAWFEAHRDAYEQEVRAPMRELIEEMDVRFARMSPEICGDVKRSMFRINRDIRFSLDKSPYKTNAGCWFYHRGASGRVGSEASEGSAGFYLHLEPAGSFIGGGLWRPPRPQLNRLRSAIAEKPGPFIRMAKSLPKRFGGLDAEDALKRMPRGYADSHPAAHWLRYQSFVSGRSLSDAQVTSAKLPDLLEREYEELLPLVRWLNGTLGYAAHTRR
ncbi:MAG TPA: DUF2461 domain-containing protein [Gemmatimonadaceae bacterium]|nr:DUF2461 domain-containing protein [Gemmatimonadaceae bacterium]